MLLDDIIAGCDSCGSKRLTARSRGRPYGVSDSRRACERFIMVRAPSGCGRLVSTSRVSKRVCIWSPSTPWVHRGNNDVYILEAKGRLRAYVVLGGTRDPGVTPAAAPWCLTVANSAPKETSRPPPQWHRLSTSGNIGNKHRA